MLFPCTPWGGLGLFMTWFLLMAALYVAGSYRSRKRASRFVRLLFLSGAGSLAIYLVASPIY